jgi:glyoxylase-like metal-dependent hydrolase (beta-lactamase superfamily II)
VIVARGIAGKPSGRAGGCWRNGPDMSDELSFDRAVDAASGEVRRLTPLVRRVIAGNSGPFTFTGTCTYIIGDGTCAVIDPGPDDAAHLAVITQALRGETVSHVVVTHTHRDHSPGARALAAMTGARIVGCGPHRAARPLSLGEINRLDAAADADHRPDGEMAEGDTVQGPGWTLTTVETPGHTANHLAFALAEERALFSADHVMAWSTSIVAPPDGSMSDFMGSLDRLKGRPETIYWPGHGGPVREPQRFLRGLINHRRMREASILNRLAAGDRTIQQIVPRIYEGLNPALQGAAALSTFAHLEDLCGRGVVRAAEGAPRLDSIYEPMSAG